MARINRNIITAKGIDNLNAGNNPRRAPATPANDHAQRWVPQRATP